MIDCPGVRPGFFPDIFEHVDHLTAIYFYSGMINFYILHNRVNIAL